MTATNLVGYFTSLPNGANIVEYVFAFDVALQGYAIISILFALLIVGVIALYFWSQDFVASSLNYLYTVTVIGFLMTLIRSSVFTDLDGNPLRLLSFSKWTIFLVLTVLVAIYDRVSDQ